jgi:hypothetical protein
MEKNKKCVDCQYKKACTGKDFPEHAYKCETCIYNMLIKEEDRKINWPQEFLNIGWF